MAKRKYWDQVNRRKRLKTRVREAKLELERDSSRSEYELLKEGRIQLENRLNRNPMRQLMQKVKV